MNSNFNENIIILSKTIRTTVTTESTPVLTTISTLSTVLLLQHNCEACGQPLPAQETSQESKDTQIFILNLINTHVCLHLLYMYTDPYLYGSP